MRALTLEDGVGVLHLPLSFPLHLGGTLASAQLGYELVGPAEAPLVVALGGISAGRHVTGSAAAPRPGWWQEIVGPGAPIDTTRWRVLAIDWLGGAGVSTGPRPGEPFPLVTSHDQANALALLLDELGVRCVARCVGASFGAMVGLALAQRHPDRVAAVVAISGAHESHPLASGWRSVQRRIVRLGLEHGEAAAREALAIARALALTTYRSPEELAGRFAGAPVTALGSAVFPIEPWLEARGADFTRRCTPEAFLALCHAIDLHRVEPEDIRTPVTLVAATSDQLVPLAQMRELRARLAGPARLLEIDTPFGHDAFLKEPGRIGALLREDLAEVVR